MLQSTQPPIVRDMDHDESGAASQGSAPEHVPGCPAARGAASNRFFEQTTCWTCGKEPLEVFKCGDCRVARYCCTECQSVAWQDHKVVCHKLKDYKWMLQESVHPKSYLMPIEGTRYSDDTRGFLRTSISFTSDKHQSPVDWGFVKFTEDTRVRKFLANGLGLWKRHEYASWTPKNWNTLKRLWECFHCRELPGHFTMMGIPEDLHGRNSEQASHQVFIVREHLRHIGKAQREIIMRYAAELGMGVILARQPPKSFREKVTWVTDNFIYMGICPLLQGAK